MSKRFFFSIAFVATLLVSAIVLAGKPPVGVPTDKDPKAYKGLSQDGIKQLQAGEILILKNVKEGENPSGMIEAALIFDKNINEVWHLIVEEVDKQKTYLPYLEKSDLVKQENGHYLVNFKLVIMGVDVDYQVDHIAEKDQYYFHWDLDKSYPNKLRVLKGFWRLYWIDEKHTLARYGTWFEIGIGVPDFVQSFLIKRDLPQSLENFKKFINSGGKWTRDKK